LPSNISLPALDHAAFFFATLEHQTKRQGFVTNFGLSACKESENYGGDVMVRAFQGFYCFGGFKSIFGANV
jgi:hypothetical protein